MLLRVWLTARISSRFQQVCYVVLLALPVVCVCVWAAARQGDTFEDVL
jgi:hypothetical protein